MDFELTTIRESSLKSLTTDSWLPLLIFHGYSENNYRAYALRYFVVGGGHIHEGGLLSRINHLVHRE